MRGNQELNHGNQEARESLTLLHRQTTKKGRDLMNAVFFTFE
jgi:hypothetical protein